jgi:hypothetical protein
VAARIRDAAGQVIEDAVLVAPGPGGPDAGADPVAARAAGSAVAAAEAVLAEVGTGLSPARLDLAPGQSGTLEVTVASRAASAIRGEVQLISPAGSWEFIPEWTTGFAVAARDSAVLRFAVTAPATARRGQRWWVIAKVMYFGRARYSEPAEVVVG